MPELPEVETVRRSLEPGLVGARVTGLWTSGKALRLARPVDTGGLEAIAVGGRVAALRRRAKYLLVDVAGRGSVLVHLGMTGQLRLVAAKEPRAPHTHVVFALDRGRELRFVDARRFGAVAPILDEEATPELASLGLDPLDPRAFTTAALRALAEGSRRSVKAFLLDQTCVAGMGNIYASEALFEARVHPEVEAGKLSSARLDAVRRAVVLVLERGLENRGTTLRDYVDATGAAGENQHALRVYGREGAPCPRRGCGTVRRITQQARSTFFCPRCQRR